MAIGRDEEVLSSARSPVVEVVIAVEFSSQPQLDAVRLVQLHDRWRGEYPVVQVQAPLPPSFLRGQEGAVEIQFSVGSPQVRLWMLVSGQQQLVQVQHDRLVLNWRRVMDDAPYPRFTTLAPEFERLWADLCAYEQEAGAPEPAVRTVEVTYINHVSLAEDDGPGAAFTHLAVEQGSQGGPLVTSFTTEVPVGHDLGDGGTSATAQLSAPPPDVAYNYTIATRLDVAKAARTEDVKVLLDAAHQRCVETFASTTTSAYRRRWGVEP